ncbi:Peptidyl-prolyl cis-trans isomerase A precursor [compost metagenome]
MARTSDINSATSQFFINLADNAFLDHGGRDFGYAVFGKVVRGMEVVDQIARVRTGNRGMHQNVPVEPVLIESAKRLYPPRPDHRRQKGEATASPFSRTLPEPNQPA